MIVVNVCVERHIDGLTVFISDELAVSICSSNESSGRLSRIKLKI